MGDAATGGTTAAPAAMAAGRSLRTLLFTDIVGWTEHLARLGDHAWREVLVRHAELVHEEVRPFEGWVVRDQGDGFFVALTTPADAIRCAVSINASVRDLGLEIRAILWKMQAGMGDVVFAPLYEVLRARGVRIELFHWVTRLGVSADGRTVDEVEVVPQVRLANGEYEPLYDVKGIPCWPSQPDWDQLEEGAALEARGVDFEREANPLGVKPRLLRAGEHFDRAVLAIPVGAQQAICAELAEVNERYRAMLENTGTVMTQALQLWVDDAAEPDLGWPFGTNSIMSAYTEPLDTYCNMSQLAERENPQGLPGPVNVGYFCAVLREEELEDQAAADRRVRENALRYLEDDMQPVWPAAVNGGGFEWELLVDPNGSRGPDRLDSQYLRANFQGTDRYVLTTKGSVAYRLRPDESGFDNLVLAGDWTRNGIDGGAVEAAITSGMLAARAISGSPADISGVSGWLVDD